MERLLVAGRAPNLEAGAKAEAPPADRVVDTTRKLTSFILRKEKRNASCSVSSDLEVRSAKQLQV
jgi:hypothetical protein